MVKLLNIVTLKALEGSRSQLTIAAIAVLNLAVSLGLIHLDPVQLLQVNDALKLALAYFFAEKVGRVGAK